MIKCITAQTPVKVHYKSKDGIIYEDHDFFSISHKKIYVSLGF